MTGDKPVHDTQIDLRCPRCGYDQRGVVETWRESCPLRGTCAECGLDFPWAEIFRPGLREPEWCVEYSPGGWRFLAPALVTFLRSCLPWSFWRRLQMWHRIRRPRLAAYSLLLATVFLAAYLSMQTALAIRVNVLFAKQQLNAFNSIKLTSQSELSRMQQWLESEEAQRWFGRFPPDERAVHLAAFEAQLDEMRRFLRMPPPEIDYAWHVAAFDAIASPWAARSGIPVMNDLDWAGSAYPAPRELLRWLEAMQAGPTAARTTGRPYPSPLPALAAALLVLFMLPVAFVLLPISRRRAKVRWAHIGRIAVYSLFIPVLLVAPAMLLAAGLCAFSAGSVMPIILDTSAATAALVVLLAVVWWAVALRRYLHMPHGWTVAVLLTVMNLAVLTCLWWLVDPGTVMDHFDSVVPHWMTRGLA